MESILKSLAVVLIFGVYLLHVVDCQLLDPQSQAVANGSAVTLTCGLAEATFTQWFSGQLPVPEKTIGVEDDTITTRGGFASLGHLSIFPFKASAHAGKYFCLAGIKGGNALYSCPAELSHAKISHTFHKEPHNTSVTVGATVVLECQPPDSNPAPFIQWKRDGSYLHGNDSRVVVLPTGNLYLMNVSIEDAGSYSCHAINPVTQGKRRSQPAVLTVTDLPAEVTSSAPTLTVYSSTTEVLEGEEVLLECAGEGVPIPSVTWLRVFRTALDPELETLPTGTLRIASASTSDSGKYECMLQNSAGAASIEITLRVKAAPRVTITPSHPQPTPDTIFTLNCSFTGTERVTVLWYKGVTNQLITLENTGSGSVPLVLDLSAPSTTGLYQCLAYSSAGCARASFNVSTVELEDPQVPQGSGDEERLTPPSITLYPTSLTLDPGKTEVLSCTASGGFGLEVRWFVDGEPREGVELSTSSGIVISTLMVSTPGLYLCVVSDAGGFVTADITVESRATPPPLLSIYSPSLEVTVGDSTNFTCIADQLVSLEWVFAGQPLPATKNITTQNGAVSVVVLEVVSPGDHGRYTCQASGTFGLVSEAVFLRVKASPPLLMPRNVQANWTVDGRVIVTWQPPAPSGLPSPLSGYKLNWDTPGRASQSALRALPRSSRSSVLEDLDIRSRYTILVWAYSRGGDGPPATITLEPLVAPPPPEPVLSITSCLALSPTSAEVDWQLSSGDIFADSLDYLLSFTCEVAVATGHVSTQPGVDTLQHLLPDCSYRVTVTALLQGEAVAESPPCGFDTPEGEVEVDLHAERLSSSSVRLTWTLPSGLTAEEVGLEVDLGDGFRPVSSDMRTLTNLDPSRAYPLELRLSQGAWQGSAFSSIPEAPPTNSDDPSSRELGLLYGVIIGTLVLACVVIVLFIVVLKYVQMNRRATDKVTNHREKQQEVFRRMSCSRSSSLSMKKPPQSAKANGVTHL